MATAEEVLAFLDECAQGYTFPMLDNGYVYLRPGCPFIDHPRSGRW